MDFHEREELYKESLLYKVAWLYYIDELTQKEIADRLSISRIKVIKMLEESRKRKIVRFHFSTLFRKKNETEQRLIDKYQLKDVFVIPWNGTENISETLGQATAMYLNDLLQDDTRIGVGYGEAISSILKNLAKISNRKISIVSMTGGVMPYIQQVGHQIFELNPSLIPAPIIMSNQKLADALMEEKAVRQVFDLAKTVKVIVTGIGGMEDQSTVLTSHLLTEKEFTNLREKGAVGDILMHFIDKDGQLVDSEIEDRLISTKLEDIKQRDYIIAAAGGAAKIAAIHTAMTHQLINVLITDEETAEMLLGEDYGT